MSRFNFLCKIITVKMSNIFTYVTYISHSFSVPSSIKISLENFYLFLNLFFDNSMCICIWIHIYVLCINTTHTYDAFWLQSPSPIYLLPSLLSLLPTSLFPTFMSCFVLWCNEFNQGHLSVLGFAISLWSTSRCRDTRKGSLEWRSSW